MKNFKLFMLAMMVAVVLTGCSTSSKDSKKESKSDVKFTEGIVSFEKVEAVYDSIEGTSEDTLICDLSKELNEDWIPTFDMTVGFKDDSINLIGVDYVMDFGDLGLDKETFKQAFDGLTSEQLIEEIGFSKDTKGIMIAVQADDDDLTIAMKLVIDLKNADEDVLKSLGMNFSDEDLNHSYKEMKEAFDELGYDCK